MSNHLHVLVFIYNVVFLWQIYKLACKISRHDIVALIHVVSFETFYDCMCWIAVIGFDDYTDLLWWK